LIVLGVNGGVRLGYQDASAALVIDGEVVAAAEEERFNRIKHSPGQWPQRSIAWVLASRGLTLRDVDVVASHGSTWGDGYGAALRGYLRDTFGATPALERVHHHEAHAASAFYGSGFQDAIVLTIDSSGDGVSTTWGVGRGGELRTLRRFSRPHSLGLFYSLITQHCGFVRDRDEFKVMGLSSYGDRDAHDLSWLLTCDDGELRLDASHLPDLPPGAPQPSRQEMLFGDSVVARLGPPRRPGTPITQATRDVAASAQRALEDAVVAMVERLHRETGLRRVCLAGGVALNCVANQRVMELPWVDDLFVQPAAGDSGIPLGAAWLVSAQRGAAPRPMTTALLGPDADEDAIAETLDVTGVASVEVDDPAEEAARRVADGQVVGWYQGQAEFGPRALGARSILASATDPGMTDRINATIKFREPFRPFCPSVALDAVHDHFDGRGAESPYMTVTWGVKDPAALPAVTAVDGTARLQTVDAARNAPFARYLDALERRTGVPVTLNTSFNVDGQPIVNTPRQAIATFFGSGLDALVLGHRVLEKRR